MHLKRVSSAKFVTSILMVVFQATAQRLAAEIGLILVCSLDRTRCLCECVLIKLEDLKILKVQFRNTHWLQWCWKQR